MRTFNRLDEHRAELPLSIGAEERLPVGQSMAVIASLSVLSWVGLILFVAALWAIF